ncbi:MAG: type VII secretion protein EssC [Butyrivibrio sp.]|nr:type VII secretion protein EssC [Butyrivibrio sp.]
MIVTLFQMGKLYSIRLPENIKGRFWIINHDVKTISEKKIVGIEAVDGKWVIKSDRKFKIMNLETGAAVKSVVLYEKRLYPVQIGKNSEDKSCILTEPFTEDRSSLTKYFIRNKSVTGYSIKIGKEQENDIVFDNKYVSRLHAVLSYKNRKWYIRDMGSSNGTYVNDKLITKDTELFVGDIIFIVGLKLVIGGDFIAVNNPDGSVLIRTNLLEPYDMPSKETETEHEEVRNTYYYRSPAFKREIDTLELTVDMPTQENAPSGTPLILTIGPSLIMGCASLSTGAMTVINTLKGGGSLVSALPTMITSVAMLSGMVLFPTIVRQRDKKILRAAEKERQSRYLKYLDNIRFEISKASLKQHEILCENYGEITAVVNENGFWERKLWSRIIGQTDFLTVRVGKGNIPLLAELKFPDSRFSIDDDVMRDKLVELKEEEKIVEDVPVTYSLIEHRVSGIVGDRAHVAGLLNNIIIQLAALHSYDEIKIIFICDESEMPYFNFIRWLPHVWNDDKNVRYIATTPDEVRELSIHLKKILNNMSEEDSKADPKTYYTVIAVSKELTEQCSAVSDILEMQERKGFCVITAYDEMKNLPKECSMVTSLSDGQGMLYDRNSLSVNRVNFVQDYTDFQKTESILMKIAGYELDLQRGKYALPEMLTFLDMFNVGKIEHLNIANRWRENNPVKSLQTPIGVNTDGKTFYLDLHEKAHGPHGLVAGMTGSGKSEFIITYILSLAVNYHPDEVAFLLIDYKGGGLAKTFDNNNYSLPHLAGTITNLDGASINRSLMSIQSELKRRQDIFNEAKNISNSESIDIYKYQKLYRRGILTKPVPHLLIISDEFAELKTQQPEFMAQLISTARIGRSLGVHLILATQKPSGVVNDQIWANSKFKVCLKVQDKADSMDMLKRPDAAEISETGRFFLQVGYNELFEKGQSAWCGAQYEPTDTPSEEGGMSVRMLDNLGNTLEENRVKKKVEEGKHGTQVAEIITYITELAAEENAYAKPLWLPTIPEIITVDGVKNKYSHSVGKPYIIKPVIGEYDDPFNQRQDMLAMDFAEGGNAIIYGIAGSGKENLLIAMLYSLYCDYSAEYLNTYILDFGAEMLGMFAEAPQTGEVVYNGDDEKVNNLFSMLREEMDKRKSIFTEYGGNLESYCRITGKAISSVIVIINNYINFIESYEKYEDEIISVTRECAKYGIYFVITNSSSSGVRFKLLQNFGQIFSLRLNDKNDYISVLGNTGGVYPSNIKGRGIFKRKETYEFQTAYPYENPNDTTEFVKAVCKSLAEDNKGKPQAPEIPTMPKILQTDKFLKQQIDLSSVIVGIDCKSMAPICWDFKKNCVTRVSAYESEDIQPFAAALIKLISYDRSVEVIVFDPDRIIQSNGKQNIRVVSGNFEEEAERFFELIKARNNEYKSTNGELPPDFDMHRICYIFMSYASLVDKFDSRHKQMLEIPLSKLSGNYNVCGIICDSNTFVGRYSAADWFTSQCRGGGIWIGNGAAEQMYMKFNKMKYRVESDIDGTKGYLIDRTKAQLIKLINDGRSEV